MKKKDSGFHNPYLYSFRLSGSGPLPKYVRNMQWFEGARTKKQNNSPATTPDLGLFVIALAIPALSFSLVMLSIFTGNDALGDGFFQISGSPICVFITGFGVAFWIFYTSLYNRVRLRYGHFEAYDISPGSPIPSAEFIGVESKLPGHVIEEGIQRLKSDVHSIEHSRRHWLILNSLIMTFGFYVIIKHTDILTGYFWIGAQIILFELVALPVIFFKKSKMDLLKENPLWPVYAEAIGYPGAKKVVETGTVNRYERGGE